MNGRKGGPKEIRTHTKIKLKGDFFWEKNKE